MLFKPTPSCSCLISNCISPIFSQLFSPHLPMARAQYLLCRARGEVVTKACGRWGMLKECDWCTVTYLSFRMYLMLIFLPGEIEELCLLGNPVLLSKYLWSTLSLWLRFILDWIVSILFDRQSPQMPRFGGCLREIPIRVIWLEKRIMACEVSLSTSRFRNTSYYCTHPTLIKKSSRSPAFFFSNTFGGTTLIVNSGNHNHEKCATNKKFPNRHV